MAQKDKQLRWYLIQCPFFHSDNFNSILCEGGEDTVAIRQTFKNVPAREAWQDKYCKSIKGCEDCFLYKNAYEKYED